MIRTSSGSATATPRSRRSDTDSERWVSSPRRTRSVPSGSRVSRKLHQRSVNSTSDPATRITSSAAAPTSTDAQSGAVSSSPVAVETPGSVRGSTLASRRTL